MPDTEQQVRKLSERVVKEAVGVGLETPMREPILEAIEESGEGATVGKRRLPLAGALLGLGAAAGYLAGRSEHEPLESLDASKMIENLVAESEVEDRIDTELELESDAEETDAEPEADEGGDTGKRLLPRILLALGVLGALALIRRRLQPDEGEEWEPIEEFEPAVNIGDEGADDGDESETEAESEGEDETQRGAENEAEGMTGDETEE